MNFRTFLQIVSFLIAISNAEIRWYFPNKTLSIPNQNPLLRVSGNLHKYGKGHDNYSIYTSCYPQSNIDKGLTSILKPETELHINCTQQESKRITWITKEEFIRTRTPMLEVRCLNDTDSLFVRLSQFYQNIKTLDFSLNCIKAIHILPYLPNITMLKYKYNDIDLIEEKAFANLPNLQILDLSHNSIEGTNLMAVFKGNYSLSSYRPLSIAILNLGYNKIQSIDRRAFEHLPRLRELHLDGNPLGTIDYSTAMAINSIQSLEVLNLAKTGLSTVPFTMFHKLMIKALYINGNYFQEVPPELAVLRNSLQFLDINENPIKKLNSNSFFGLSNLKEIVAAGMKELTAVNEGTFLHLYSLEKLTLSYNPNLMFIDPFAFGFGISGSLSIKIVRLDNNNLRHISEHLLPWDQLKALDLSGNPWYCDCGLKWILDSKDKRRLNIIENSGMKCAFSNWPEATSIDVYNKTIRKFNCAHLTENNLIHKKSIFVNDVIGICILLIIFITVGYIAIMIIVKRTRYRRVMVNDILTHSKSVKEDFTYNKLKENSICDL